MGELDKIIYRYRGEYANLKNQLVKNDNDPRIYNTKYIVQVLYFYKHFFEYIIHTTIEGYKKKSEQKKENKEENENEKEKKKTPKRVRFEGGKTKRGGKKNARRTKKIKKNKIK